MKVGMKLEFIRLLAVSWVAGGARCGGATDMAQDLAAPSATPGTQQPRAAADQAEVALTAQRPWPGMRPYREQDARYYFGRDAEIDELLARTERSLLTLLYARGGLGKTSLVRAGLAPRLVERGWLPVYLRPRGLLDGGRDPIAETIRAVQAAAHAGGIEATADFDAASLWELFHRADIDLWDATNRLVVPVLVLDQFEEIFQVIDDDPGVAPRVRALLDGIAELVENRLPQRLTGDQFGDEFSGDSAQRFDVASKDFRVVLSFREDYLPQVRKLKAIVPSVIENHVRLEPLSARQALQVVEGAGGELVDRDAATLLVKSVGRPAGLLQRLLDVDAGLPSGGEVVNVEVEPAILSVVCYHLNAERLQRGKSTIDVGLVKRKSAEDIFDDYYSANVRKVDAAARRFVESSLVTPGGERVLYPMRAVEAHGPALVAAMKQLVDQGVLRSEWFAGEQRIEISHDLLLRPIRRAINDRAQRRVLGLAAAVVVGLIGAASYWVWAEQQQLEVEIEAQIARRKADLQAQLERRQGVVEALLVAHLPAADRDDMAELIFDVNGAGGDGELVAGIQRVFDWTVQRSTRRDLDIDTARRLRQNAVEYAQIAIDRGYPSPELIVPLSAKLRTAVIEACAKGLSINSDQSVVWFAQKGGIPAECR